MIDFLKKQLFTVHQNGKHQVSEVYKLLCLTIFLQLYMTSSRKVMGQYANHTYTNVLLWGIGIVVTVMNIYLLIVG